MTPFFRKLVHTCTFSILIFTPFVAPAAGTDWSFAKTISTKGYTPVFLATTPTGDVAAAAFNNSKSETIVPLILVHKPLSGEPNYFAICSWKFPAQRGFSGVAVDDQGNYYVAADTGVPATCWIRKYKANGQLDSTFARGGEISAGRRFVGLALTGKYLLSTVAFGQLVVFDKNTGAVIGSAPLPPGETPLIRDIAIDPAKKIVFGVARGAAWVWEGGSFDRPQDYTLRRLSADAEQEAGGEGISFDPVARKVLVPHRHGGTLLTVSEDRQISKDRIIDPATQPSAVSDPVLLADGMTLFVSDMQNSRLYVMKRAGAAAAAVPSGDVPSLASVVGSSPTPVQQATPAAQPAGDFGTGNVSWVRGYDKAAANASASGKPLLLYFRTAGSRRCQEMEPGYLASSEFARLAANLVPCMIDLDEEGVLGQQFGVFRVPVIALYKPNGERVEMLSGKTIEPTAIETAVAKATAK